MNSQDLKKRGDALLTEFRRRLRQDIGFGDDLKDGLFCLLRCDTLHVQLAEGDIVTMAKLMYEAMMENPKMAETMMAAFMCYLSNNQDDDQRLFFAKRIIDMTIDKQEEEGDSDKPRVKIIGFDQMPEEMKDAVGKALSEELSGHIKPKKEDIKSSDN